MRRKRKRNISFVTHEKEEDEIVLVTEVKRKCEEFWKSISDLSIRHCNPRFFVSVSKNICVIEQLPNHVKGVLMKMPLIVWPFLLFIDGVGTLLIGSLLYDWLFSLFIDFEMGSGFVSWECHEATTMYDLYFWLRWIHDFICQLKSI